MMVSVDEACEIALKSSKVEYGGYFVSGIAAGDGHCFVSVSMRDAEAPLRVICVNWGDGSCPAIMLPSEEGYALVEEFMRARAIDVPEQFR